ncbi:hypothetical protein ES705_41341 [subsurface metagenome]
MENKIKQMISFRESRKEALEKKIDKMIEDGLSVKSEMFKELEKVEIELRLLREIIGN